MSLFICDLCHGIDNSSRGLCWRVKRNEAWFGPSVPAGQRRCSRCVPTHFLDGKPTGKGVWHNVFPYEVATPEIIKAYKEATGWDYTESLGLTQVLAGIPPVKVYKEST